ncbi:tetratricopeptide repeat-containing response regulator [Accumulibacter sp.]|uniref:tetratricopeptide repeat-containing response regulator n=1 Tax=Accumulibacter sp. TaxID=2053492 RepID=UPI0025FBF949|nr:tetratricopeptide repeat-containing response regulator [Accumulibacter sp.]MCM8595949.1 response regulator [Accumulibacter sp.]MCM8624526.1 response regulator [Accumulibacter sp.]MDS4050098.1 response regulator [Accumulibacter sp.]
MRPADINADLLHSLGSSLTRMRALLVDRYPNARSSLRMMLGSMGVNAIQNAGNSTEVLRQVKAHSFDIVLSDYLLEDGRDGQQLLEELRQQHLLPRSTVFMIVTSERAYRNVVAVAELAPDDYLIKPFSADELQARLLRAIHKKKFFGQVHAHLDNGAYALALASCDRLVAEDSGYLFDALRLKGEILNALGRHGEAQLVYQQVLAERLLPWARMGLAVALRGQRQLPEAELLGVSLVDEFPEFTAAYDFLAEVREELGRPVEAQQVLLRAAAISPNNAARQRLVGDVATRNQDLPAAEKAYAKVIERRQGSSLTTLEDYANLSRVMLARGHLDGARRLAEQLRRDWRGKPEGEFAALVIDSLRASEEDELVKARLAAEKALAVRQALTEERRAGVISRRLTLDLAQACLASGDETNARQILRQFAAEHHEDRAMIGEVQAIYARAGKEEEGQTLLAEVGKEIVEINNRGVLAARRGDVEGSVRLLTDAAERVPNLQFLVNATKAIFTLLELKGWDPGLAKRGLRFLQMAQSRDLRNPRVISARELYERVAAKYGVAAVPFTASRNIGNRDGL